MKTLKKKKKANKVYSHIAEIPKGTASDRITEGCLVLEGGAFRGLYTQGFLDAMMVHDLNMQCVIGVSAGALGGMNYVSGQIGRSARVNLGFRHDSRYVGAKALVHGHSILDVGFLTEERGIFGSIDRERFERPERRFIAVTTNCLTGEATYFEKGKCSDIMQAVRASATMPYISQMVMIDGAPHLDGGCACKIPYRWALDQGFEKIVVIRTRDPEFRKKEKKSSERAAFRVYHKYPEFAQKLASSITDYNMQCDEIEKLHAEGALMRIAPTAPVNVSRIEGDVEKLGALYWLGWNDCVAALEELKDYLGV